MFQGIKDGSEVYTDPWTWRAIKMRRLQADFNRTFKALEDGLQVQHIAESDLKTCHPGDPAASILNDPSASSYDQFPVRNSRGIVGVLERPLDRLPVGDVRVDEVMLPLNSSMLVADSQPVASLLDVLMPTRYRLVVQGDDINGIVTASDLLKLPVRLYAFMLVTHLEMLMAATIRKQFRGQVPQACLSRLNEERRNKVLDKVNEYAQKRLDPDPVEFTDFCDKRDVLKHFHPPKGRFERDMKRIEALRNSLAHAGNYLNDYQDLEVFLDQIGLTSRYISYLRGHLGPHEF
jgi:predicted transcriptional regulator